MNLKLNYDVIKKETGYIDFLYFNNFIFTFSESYFSGFSE